MMDKRTNTKMVWRRFRNDQGVTLVELLMGLVIMGLVSTATYAAYQVSQRTFNTDRQVMEIQQQLRGAFHYMENQIRIAGFDDAEIGGLGVADVRSYKIPTDLDQAELGDATDPGSPVLSLTYNLDRTVSTATTTISFYLYNDSVFDDGNDRITDLCVSNAAPGAVLGAGGRDLVAESIESIDFAFAVDQDGDDVLDIDGAGNIIWAIDTDNDNILDSFIPQVGGIPAQLSTIVGYPATVALEDIEVVRIWMLARTPPALEVKMRGLGPFQVGRNLIDPETIDGRSIFRRRMLTANVKRMN